MEDLIWAAQRILEERGRDTSRFKELSSQPSTTSITTTKTEITSISTTTTSMNPIARSSSTSLLSSRDPSDVLQSLSCAFYLGASLKQKTEKKKKKKTKKKDKKKKQQLTRRKSTNTDNNGTNDDNFDRVWAKVQKMTWELMDEFNGCPIEAAKIDNYIHKKLIVLSDHDESKGYNDNNKKKKKKKVAKRPKQEQFETQPQPQQQPEPQEPESSSSSSLLESSSSSSPSLPNNAEVSLVRSAGQKNWKKKKSSVMTDTSISSKHQPSHKPLSLSQSLAATSSNDKENHSLHQNATTVKKKRKNHDYQQQQKQQQIQNQEQEQQRPRKKKKEERRKQPLGSSEAVVKGTAEQEESFSLLKPLSSLSLTSPSKKNDGKKKKKKKRLESDEHGDQHLQLQKQKQFEQLRNRSSLLSLISSSSSSSSSTSSSSSSSPTRKDQHKEHKADQRCKSPTEKRKRNRTINYEDEREDDYDETAFYIGKRIEVQWKMTDGTIQWYPGTVVDMSSLSADIQYDDGEFGPIYNLAAATATSNHQPNKNQTQTFNYWRVADTVSPATATAIGVTNCDRDSHYGDSERKIHSTWKVLNIKDAPKPNQTAYVPKSVPESVPESLPESIPDFIPEFVHKPEPMPEHEHELTLPEPVHEAMPERDPELSLPNRKYEDEPANIGRLTQRAQSSPAMKNKILALLSASLKKTTVNGTTKTINDKTIETRNEDDKDMPKIRAMKSVPPNDGLEKQPITTKAINGKTIETCNEDGNDKPNIRAFKSVSSNDELKKQPKKKKKKLKKLTKISSLSEEKKSPHYKNKDHTKPRLYKESNVEIQRIRQMRPKWKKACTYSVLCRRPPSSVKIPPRTTFSIEGSHELVE